MAAPLKFVIVGAGLVGSLWAVLLRKRGFQVALYEKRGDIRQGLAAGDRSINLVITSRGLFGLQQGDLLEKALGLAVPVTGRMIHGKSGELTYQPYGQEGERNYSISRSVLNRFLLEAAVAAGAEVFFDHELQELQLDKKSAVFMSKGSPQTVSYNFLFGADGAGSAVRKSLVQLQKTRETVDWLEADYLELHLPQGAGGQPQIDKNVLHIWPRGSYMMMALANLDDSFTVTMYLPKQGPVSFAKIQTANQAEAFFAEEFADAIALIPNYLEEFMKNPRGRLGTVRASNWVVNDDVVLMGDAAHAIVPFFGQGMNSGFEDCTALLRLLDENKGEWAKALKRYDEVQRPNANAIADMALENWSEMRDKVGDASFLLRKKVEARLEKEFPQLYKSRYGMVTYTLIPYALAQEAGRLQDEVLQCLCAGIDAPEKLSLNTAEELLKKEIQPFLDRHQINLLKSKFVPGSR